MKELVFAPIEFCGRKWEWIREDSEGCISKIALKAITGFALLFITPLAGLLAFGGALVFSVDTPNPCDTIDPQFEKLREKINENQEVLKLVDDNLETNGVKCCVLVSNAEENHCTITLRNTTSTAFSKIISTVQSLFSYGGVLSLQGLHCCLDGRSSKEEFDRLKMVLSLQKGLEFSFTADPQGKIHTEVVI